jgi:hypothetical protein
MRTFVATFVLLQAPLFAQSGWQIFAGPSFNHVQVRPPVVVFAGTTEEVFHLNQASLWGGTGSVSVYPMSWLGATLEGSDAIGNPKINLVGTTTQKIHLNQFTVLLGPTFHTRVHNFGVFGRLMFGTEHGAESLEGITLSRAVFAWSAGGGIDYALKSFLAVRISQIDFIRTYFEHGQQGNWRESVGVVFHFGGNDR